MEALGPQAVWNLTRRFGCRDSFKFGNSLSSLICTQGQPEISVYLVVLPLTWDSPLCCRIILNVSSSSSSSSTGGTRRDFFLGCPLAASALDTEMFLVIAEFFPSCCSGLFSLGQICVLMRRENSGTVVHLRQSNASSQVMQTTFNLNWESDDDVKGQGFEPPLSTTPLLKSLRVLLGAACQDDVFRAVDSFLISVADVIRVHCLRWMQYATSTSGCPMKTPSPRSKALVESHERGCTSAWAPPNGGETIIHKSCTRSLEASPHAFSLHRSF